MAKEFFRFLRGELNGYYITNLNQAFVEYSRDIKKFLIGFQSQQMEKGQISNTTLFNLGKFACVKLPRRKVSESTTSLFLTESHKVDDTEFSERGLYDRDVEEFGFYHTDESITTPDINTLASENLRSSMVGTETPTGYIPEGATDVIDDNGNVRPEKVLPEPPSGIAYSDYYNDDFLFLAEGGVSYESISTSLYMDLFKALQWIRYNGVSIASFVEILSLLCPNGLVRIQRIEVNANNRLVNYVCVYDPTVVVSSKEQRLSLLRYLIMMKFKQVRLVEV